MTGLESQLSELNSFKSQSSIKLQLVVHRVTFVNCKQPNHRVNNNKQRKKTQCYNMDSITERTSMVLFSSTFAEASTIQRPSNGGVALGVSQTLVTRTWGISFSFWSFHPDSRPENLRSLIPLQGWRGEGSKSSWFRYPVIIFFHLDTTLPRQFHLV